jgi:hypothetical protein
MKNFKVLKSDQKEWSEILSRSLFYDFYHTKSYNVLENDGESLLFVASIENNFIAYPLILRKIPNTNYFDCTSVYGYCGPISNLQYLEISEALKLYFKDSLMEYFEQNNIVSCFSRLHPVFENENILDNFGKTIGLNKTIAINLTIPIEEQRRKYRKSNKYEINKLKKENYVVEIAKAPQEIDAFVDIYTETMERVKATENYFFDKDYFHSFLNNPCFASKLFLAKKEGEVIAGAIFTITNKIMQYHLAGTKLEYIRKTPMKLILDEARLLGNELNLDYLHLGGGVGGSDDDSLYKFKAGFSDLNFSYKVWQFISNQEVYDQLVEQKNKNTNSSFFPLYRA